MQKDYSYLKGNMYAVGNKGFSGGIHTKEWKEKQSERMKGNKCAVGLKHTEEWRIQHSKFMSKHTKGRTVHKEGCQCNFCRNIRHESLSIDQIKTLSDSLKGEKNGMWLGGISFEPYTPEFYDSELRRQIKIRDNCTCQLCGMREKFLITILKWYLVLHHIDYDKKNCDITNLITLCVRCNSVVNANRSYWMAYFYEKLMRTGVKY